MVVSLAELGLRQESSSSENQSELTSPSNVDGFSSQEPLEQPFIIASVTEYGIFVPRIDPKSFMPKVDTVGWFHPVSGVAPRPVHREIIGRRFEGVGIDTSGKPVVKATIFVAPNTGWQRPERDAVLFGVAQKNNGPHGVEGQIEHTLSMQIAERIIFTA